MKKRNKVKGNDKQANQIWQYYFCKSNEKKTVIWFEFSAQSSYILNMKNLFQKGMLRMTILANDFKDITLCIEICA